MASAAVMAITKRSISGSEKSVLSNRKRLRCAAIVFSYDHGHMFCALDDVFAKFVTAITGSG